MYGDETGVPLSIQGIVKELNLMGIAKRHNTNKALGGWSIASVFDILASERYIGKWYYQRTMLVRAPDTNALRQVLRPRNEWIEVAIPPVITAELYQLARARATKNLERAKQNHKHTYSFSGMMGCMTCSQRFAGGTMKHTTIRTYCCGARTPPWYQQLPKVELPRARPRPRTMGVDCTDRHPSRTGRPGAAHAPIRSRSGQ